MKNLFFVSVALGIFSGTSISVKAQTSANNKRWTNAVAEKRTTNFIEGIEMVPGSTGDGIPAAPVKKNTGDLPAGSLGHDLSVIETCSAIQFKYALILNCEVESITNLPLYNFIEEWWGTRYHYGGSSRNGIDCSALAGTLLGRVYGITTPRTARAQYDACEKVDREDLKEGDLVFFNTRGGVSHVGVYLGNGYFTHASVKNGVTINNLDENYYSKRFIRGGRVTAVCTE